VNSRKRNNLRKRNCCLLSLTKSQVGTNSYNYFLITFSFKGTISTAQICLEVLMFNRPNMRHGTRELDKIIVLSLYVLLGLWSSDATYTYPLIIHFLSVKTASIDTCQLIMSSLSLSGLLNSFWPIRIGFPPFPCFLLAECSPRFGMLMGEALCARGRRLVSNIPLC
jgi:hypothetical protein